jgi:NAD(P)-dependent dehydrogenase (short-subunit alcohol dehydrogenase family)
MNSPLHALITGATSGIGLSLARSFLQEGYRVSVCSRSAKTKSHLFAPQLKANNVQLIDMDATLRPDVESAFKEAKAGFGSVSVLINNAGQALSETFEKSTAELLTNLMSTNLMSVFNCSQVALMDMKSNHFGRIINIASTAGLIGYAYTSAYCASKHAVIGLSKSLALELAKSGITVNCICPGFTDTPLAEHAIKNIATKTQMSLEDAKKSLTKLNPMGRMINPEEIAHTALWLASKGAASINGQAVCVSGGEVMN